MTWMSRNRLVRRERNVFHFLLNYEIRSLIKRSIFHTTLFLRLGLNGFKEAISQQESEEENGCGLIVFGVTFVCLCRFPLQEFVGLGLL